MITSHYNSPSPKHIDYLTGLRFFAVFLVFCSHMHLEKNFGDSSLLILIFKQGFVGVSFFFVLSGFILSYTYENQIKNLKFNNKKFLLKRFFRLWPLHFITMIPFVFLNENIDILNIISIFLNLSFLQSWIPNVNIYYDLNTPSWSLSNEIFFYICFFPFLSLTIKRKIQLFLFLLTTIFFIAIFSDFLNLGKIFFGNKTFVHWLFYIFPGFRLIEFLGGVLIFYMWQNNIKFPKVISLISYLLLILVMFFSNKVSLEFRQSLLFLIPIYIFLISHLNSYNFIEKFWSNKFIVLLGNASFSFYMIHFLSIQYLSNFFNSFINDKLMIFILIFVTTYLFSIIIYVFFEKKCTNFLNKKFNN